MKNTLRTLKTRSLKRAQSEGFTLIELMIVVVIVGILSAVAIPNFLNQKGKAQVGATNAAAVGLITACELAVTEGTDPAQDSEVTRLKTAYEAKQIGTVTLAADSCTVTIPAGGIVKTAGTYTSFGTKTPAAG